MMNCGQFVLSIAGRGKGRIFIVINVIDEEYVYIADGMLRSINKPKKKKLKHLRLITNAGVCVNDIAGLDAVNAGNDKRLAAAVKAASESYRENREGLFCQKMM